MGFLFPIFLIAGIVLIIPVLIHLFNLRKYKRVNFSDTRFLRTIQLKTKKQAKLQNIRLLLARLLFLATLIFAFAQPFFGINDKNRNSVQVLYIDNSQSMTLRKGQISLLQTAKEKAIKFIENTAPDTRFIIIDNARKNAQRPVTKNEAITSVREIQPLFVQPDIEQILAAVSSAQQQDNNEQHDVYLFSDMQLSSFFTDKKSLQTEKNSRLHFVPVQEKNIGNIYIDTAYFTTPNIDLHNTNSLVVTVKKSGETKSNSTNLQLIINDQLRTATEVTFDGTDSWTDTLDIQISGSEWQRIELNIQDRHLTFDDTFRLAARTAPELSVLVISESAVSPYLQTVIKSYPGFNLQSTSSQNIKSDTWNQYSLIILQNTSSLSAELTDAINHALNNGQSVLMFPGNITQVESFNNALGKIAGITFEQADTTRQTVTNIQESHLLFADVFENIPDNVQMPVSKKRYPIHASLSANQQIVMSFRDGKPFVAQYNISKGKLYICSSPLDEQSGNFQTSHYFAPLVYKMASLNGNSNIYTQTIGSNKPIWIHNKQHNERNLWHLKGNSYEGIPPQTPSGTGVNISTDRLLLSPGYYTLSRNENEYQSLIIAFNASRKESELAFAEKNEIEQLFNSKNIYWLQQKDFDSQFKQYTAASTPLWKYFLIAALIFLIIETLLLYKRPQKPVSSESKIV